MVKFRKPPVVETVLSVQFKPLDNISGGMLGKFWASLGDDWPTSTDTASLEPEFEQFGPENVWERGGLRFKVGSQVDLRLQFLSKDQDRMIQVQNGRFFFNWIGHGETYPSYENVKPEFDDYWEQFRAFLVQNSSQTVEANQWEVMYVNHIPGNPLWGSPCDLPNMLRFLGPVSLDSVPANLETVRGEWRYEIPDKRGRLYVRLGRTQKEGQSFIVLTLVARGPIDKEAGRTLDEGIRLGHEAIINAFVALTTDEARELWEPVHENASR